MASSSFPVVVSSAAAGDLFVSDRSLMGARASSLAGVRSSGVAGVCQPPLVSGVIAPWSRSCGAPLGERTVRPMGTGEVQPVDDKEDEEDAFSVTLGTTLDFTTSDVFVEYTPEKRKSEVKDFEKLGQKIAKPLQDALSEKFGQPIVDFTIDLEIQNVSIVFDGKEFSIPLREIYDEEDTKLKSDLDKFCALGRSLMKSNLDPETLDLRAASREDMTSAYVNAPQIPMMLFGKAWKEWGLEDLFTGVNPDIAPLVTPLKTILQEQISEKDNNPKLKLDETRLRVLVNPKIVRLAQEMADKTQANPDLKEDFRKEFLGLCIKIIVKEALVREDGGPISEMSIATYTRELCDGALGKIADESGKNFSSWFSWKSSKVRLARKANREKQKEFTDAQKEKTEHLPKYAQMVARHLVSDYIYGRLVRKPDDLKNETLGEYLLEKIEIEGNIGEVAQEWDRKDDEWEKLGSNGQSPSSIRLGFLDAQIQKEMDRRAHQALQAAQAAAANPAPQAAAQPVPVVPQPVPVPASQSVVQQPVGASAGTGVGLPL